MNTRWTCLAMVAAVGGGIACDKKGEGAADQSSTEEDGPMEDAGEWTDDAAEDTGDAVEDAAEETEEAADDFGDNADDPEID